MLKKIAIVVLEHLTQERDALRDELEQVRCTLENERENHRRDERLVDQNGRAAEEAITACGELRSSNESLGRQLAAQRPTIEALRAELDGIRERHAAAMNMPFALNRRIAFENVLLDPNTEEIPL